MVAGIDDVVVAVKATKFVIRVRVSGRLAGVVDSGVRMRKRWFVRATTWLLSW